MLRRFLKGDRRREVFAPSSLCVWSQMPWRNLQIKLWHLRFFARPPSNIQRIVKICDVDRFLWKPFWFFLRIFSISGSIQSSSRVLEILAAMDATVIPRNFLVPHFLGKGGGSPLSISLLCSGYIRCCNIGAVCRQISLFSGSISSGTAAFLVLIFLSTTSNSCVKCPTLMSSLLLMIFVIVSSVSLGDFPRRFLKCCFHRGIRSSLLVAFSLALTVLFLLLSSFTYCHYMLDCLQPSL